MAPYILSSVITFLYFLSVVSTLSLPASSSALNLLSHSQGNATNSLQLPSNEWTWLWISGDGSQIVPINGPQDTPTNLTGSANGHSYTFGFANYHGTPTPRPGLAKFLFDCEFGLFGQVPASTGVWTAYPGGKYVCNGNLPGMIRMNLVENSVGWKMAYHDLAFLIKVLHDTEGVKDEAPFFDFVFNYTDELEKRGYQRVVNGEWVKRYGGVSGS
ncbi:hypothetical protein BDR22DRAFT_888998 [Usnea florida]